MVRSNLQGYEQGRYQSPETVFSPVYPYHTRYCGRDVGQRNQLPDVSGRNNDEEIRRKGPDNRAQGRHPYLKVEGSQQNIEAYQQDKHIPGTSRKIQMIQVLYPVQRTAGRVAGRNLIRRHSSEQCVGPAGRLSGLFLKRLGFLARSDTCCCIMLCQDTSFGDCRIEIGKRDHDKKHNCYNIRK